MENSQQLLQDAAAVILCGGQGSRMKSRDLHKVCFPIDGVPAIVRTVRMFHDVGIRKVVLVVGALAENVISTVGAEFPDVAFVYQHEQLGTGHAAAIGARALERLGHEGMVFVTMGDKVIQPHVVGQLAESYLRKRADMAFVTAPKVQDGTVSGSGRIVSDKEGRILGNVEVRDIQRARILEALKRLAERRDDKPIGFQEIEEIARKHIPSMSKIEVALGRLLEKAREQGELTGRELREMLGADAGRIRLNDKTFPPDQIEKKAKTVGYSFYLASARFWSHFLPLLSNDNAQSEYYLTEVINMGAEDGAWKVVQHTIKDPTEVMAFNSPDELLRIEDVFRRRALAKPSERIAAPLADLEELSNKMYRSAGKWLELFESGTPGLRKKMTDIYGEEAADERRDLFIRALRLFIEHYGPERKAIVVRAPGRINLLGRHVDHRGGAINVMAIDRDVVFVAAPREDDVVTLRSMEPDKFPDAEFSVSELLGDIDWEDWLSYVNSDHVRELLGRYPGDWSNYVKASLLRLQQSFRNVRIRGFDAAVVGDIPMAAGLSSSSALVVASAEIAVAFNRIDVTPAELVDLCGEGEWFVGSRGGAGDHTAIRLSRRGHISHVRFLPFKMGEACDFPEDCRVIIAHSGINARKSAMAKDQFNEKVAAYEMAFMLLKDRLPGCDHLLEHVRDINPDRLNCSMSDIYRMLLSVPEKMTADEIRDAVSARHRERLETVLATHKHPEHYDLRGVLMFGVAECRRSLLAPQLLRNGNIQVFGELMRISHDGDRVARSARRRDGSWRREKYRCDCSDEALLRLCEDLGSEDPDRVLRAQLHRRPGSYGCSLPEIDQMVDVVNAIPGVHGAQLGGAGLGGCIMILLRPDAVEETVDALNREYYENRKRHEKETDAQPVVHVCHPVAGSGPIMV